MTHRSTGFECATFLFFEFIYIFILGCTLQFTINRNIRLFAQVEKFYNNRVKKQIQSNTELYTSIKDYTCIRKIQVNYA